LLYEKRRENVIPGGNGMGSKDWECGIIDHLLCGKKCFIMLNDGRICEREE
jgi:hypothetical protein